ncbi:tyrosine-type recombinase/integrase [Sphingomonas rubra]|uniref:tyrosine-type recombinase/integrase n=1 Tax=Sphingomonas rubra TaxID=634430 RepID=UPI001FE08B7A|nr:site-specific integrase [Sphingomonas rubra]
MPYANVPAFISLLKDSTETIGRLALLFTIYTAARSGETRHACWSHIDLEQRLWKRPAHLMKMRRDHTVTLNEGAVAVLRKLEPLRRERHCLLFPGTKGQPLSDMTLSKIVRQSDTEATVHGFRSSFRDWAAEQMADIPDAVAEAALAHSVSDKVMAAYKRTNFIAMRHTLLEGWSTFITSAKPDAFNQSAT